MVDEHIRTALVGCDEPKPLVRIEMHDLPADRHSPYPLPKHSNRLIRRGRIGCATRPSLQIMPRWEHMDQRISFITPRSPLPTWERSRRFYIDGLGWSEEFYVPGRGAG